MKFILFYFFEQEERLSKYNLSESCGLKKMKFILFYLFEHEERLSKYNLLDAEKL